jgi:hypothetical protein
MKKHHAPVGGKMKILHVCPYCGEELIWYHSGDVSRAVCRKKCHGWKVINLVDRRRSLARHSQKRRDFKKRILKKTDGTCFHCGKALQLAEMTIGFKAKGGPESLDNFVPSCAECFDH